MYNSNNVNNIFKKLFYFYILEKLILALSGDKQTYLQQQVQLRTTMMTTNPSTGEMSLFKTTVLGTCPGGFCELIKDFSEVLVVILCIDGFIFFVTLVPPLFNWEKKKPDGRKRIW